LSKVYQALKKAEKESVVDKGILSSCGEVEKSMEIISAPNISSFDKHLVSLLDPKSIAAEQYRKLRTRILQFPDSSLKTVLVTSATPFFPQDCSCNQRNPSRRKINNRCQSGHNYRTGG
jgi:hypothetical protein